jgi:hypothetical protein
MVGRFGALFSRLFDDCVCRKLNSERSGDAIHPGLDVQLRARTAGSVVRLARLCSASASFQGNASVIWRAIPLSRRVRGHIDPNKVSAIQTDNNKRRTCLVVPNCRAPPRPGRRTISRQSRARSLEPMDRDTALVSVSSADLGVAITLARCNCKRRSEL